MIFVRPLNFNKIVENIILVLKTSKFYPIKVFFRVLRHFTHKASVTSVYAEANVHSANWLMSVFINELAPPPCTQLTRSVRSAVPKDYGTDFNMCLGVKVNLYVPFNPGLRRMRCAAFLFCNHVVFICNTHTWYTHTHTPSLHVRPWNKGLILLFDFREEAPDRSKLFSQHASVHTQSQLPVRRMAESYQEVLIPLSSKPELQEKYINWFKTIRIGKILEDLDTFAGRFKEFNLW